MNKRLTDNEISEQGRASRNSVGAPELTRQRCNGVVYLSSQHHWVAESLRDKLQATICAKHRILWMEILNTLNAFELASDAPANHRPIHPARREPSAFGWLLSGILSTHCVFPVHRHLRLGRFYRPAPDACEALSLDFKRSLDLTIPLEAFSKVLSEIRE